MYVYIYLYYLYDQIYFIFVLLDYELEIRVVNIEGGGVIVPAVWVWWAKSSHSSE